MKLLTILSIFLLSFYSYSQEVVTGDFLIRDGIYYHQDTNELVTGIIEGFYDDGQLRARRNYRDGQEEGLWENFHENGQLDRRGNYIDRIQDGLWEGFWRNGQLEYRGNYIDGEPDGLWEWFYEDGRLIETKTYRNGELVE